MAWGSNREVKARRAPAQPPEETQRIGPLVAEAEKPGTFSDEGIRNRIVAAQFGADVLLVEGESAEEPGATPFVGHSRRNDA